ncbi:MAG: PKD domain-containing protein, partial [Anaerolineales bacterium]|nr:PKD domain-containing protein [Anaerolineales bacterium]
TLRTETVNPDDPQLTLTLFLRTAEGEQKTTLPLWTGLPPSGQAVVSPGRAAVGQPVQFQADTNGSGPFTQLWFTGDGRVIPANNPVVVYPLVGTYKVDLHLANPLGVHESSSNIVVVPDPVAFFNVSDTTPGVGQTLQFNSQSGGQPPLAYIWDFGDGSLATEPNPTHRYLAPGSYTVNLLVRNAYGEAQNSVTINVGNAPIADMEAKTEASFASRVQGQAYTDDQTQKVTWDMGDGTVYDGEVVTHRYRQ